MPVSGNKDLKIHLKELNAAIIKNCKEQNADELVEASLKAIRHDLMEIYNGNVTETKEDQNRKIRKYINRIKTIRNKYKNTMRMKFEDAHTIIDCMNKLNLLDNEFPQIKIESTYINSMTKYPILYTSPSNKQYGELIGNALLFCDNFPNPDVDPQKIMEEITGESQLYPTRKLLNKYVPGILDTTIKPFKSHISILNNRICGILESIFTNQKLEALINNYSSNSNNLSDNKLKIEKLLETFRKKHNKLASNEKDEVLTACDEALTTVKKNKFGTQATIRSSFESLKKELEKIK